MASKIQTITDMLRGNSRLPDKGVHTYHDAKNIRNALRRHNPFDRIEAVRKVLKFYTVTALLTEDGRIELRDGARRKVLS